MSGLNVASSKSSQDRNLDGDEEFASRLRSADTRDANTAFLRATGQIRRIRKDLPIYLFSGSEGPVGQRLEGVRVLRDRYRSAGITSIAHDFYPGGRHEMVHELNRREVFTNLLVWISGVVGSVS
jgi:alpha-beta hydrolase superfamily lysophospholipase